jgi:hypothetical protein
VKREGGQDDEAQERSCSPFSTGASSRERGLEFPQTVPVLEWRAVSGQQPAGEMVSAVQKLTAAC